MTKPISHYKIFEGTTLCTPAPFPIQFLVVWHRHSEKPFSERVRNVKHSRNVNMNETFLKRNKETSRPWNRANPDQGQMEQSGDVTTFYLYFWPHFQIYFWPQFHFYLEPPFCIYSWPLFHLYFNLIFVYIFVHFFIYIFELSNQPTNQSKTKQSNQSNYQKNQTKESSGK